MSEGDPADDCDWMGGSQGDSEVAAGLVHAVTISFLTISVSRPDAMPRSVPRPIIWARRRMETMNVSARGELERIYRAAVEAVDPARLTARALDAGIPDAARVYVLAVGKASLAMASVLATRLGDRLAAATVVALPGAPASLPSDSRITLCESSHPLPSEKSADA